MVDNTTGKSGPDAGFFEKNFQKLKVGQLWEYIISRIIMFFAGMTVGLYYLRDAAYVHSADGVPESILYAVALIFLMNGIRKMFWSFIKLRNASWDNSVVEKPHNPGETFAQRLGLRFPMGRRRHLVSAMALLSEGFICALLIVSFVAFGINEGLFQCSWQFPFVLKPFVWAEMTFPENGWFGLVIIGGARLLSYLNSSLFLLKIPQVRARMIGTLHRILQEGSPLKGIGLEVIEFFQQKTAANPACGTKELATKGMANMLLSLYKTKESLNGFREELVDLLAVELDTHEYHSNDLPLIWKFIEDQLALIKKRAKTL